MRSLDKLHARNTDGRGAAALHLLNEGGGPTKSKTSKVEIKAAQAACLIAVVSISWDTLDEAIVVANFVMQRVMSAAGAVIRPRARRARVSAHMS